MWRRAVLPVAVLLIIPMAAQTVAAGQSDVDLQPQRPPELVPPGSETIVDVKIVYTYDGQGPTSGSVTVHLTLTVDDQRVEGFDATISPDPIEIDVNDQEKRGTAFAELTLQMPEDARAFQEGEVRIDAEAEDSGNVEGSEDTAVVIVGAEYVPGIKLTPPDGPVQIRNGQPNRIPVEVTNQANGQIDVRLRILEEPSGLDAGGPSPKLLSANPGSNSTRLDVLAIQTGDEIGDGDVVMRADYWFWREPDTEESSETIRVAVEGASSLLPMVGGAVVVIAIAGAAVWWVKFR